MSVLPDDGGVREILEVGVGRHQARTVTPGRRVHQGVSHREAVGEGDVGRFERQRLIDGRDGGPPHRRDRRQRPLLGDVTPDDLIDLVDFNRRDEQGFAALEVGREAAGQRTIGQVLDPAAGIDQDQSRSFFSRNPRDVVPAATPRYAFMGRSGTR